MTGRHVRTGGRGTALLTLGRLPVAVELARALHRIGWRVVVADPLGLHLCRFSNAVTRSVRVRAPATDPDGWLEDIAAVRARESVELVVPASEEVVHAARLPGRVRCPPHATVLALHDKWRFAAWALEAGLPVPETALAGEAAGLAARVDHVIKPRLSSSGAGVLPRRAGDPLPMSGDAHVVQQRLGPAELSTCTLASRGEAVASVAYRALLVSGSVAVRFESVAIPGEVRRTIETCCAAFAFDGALSFDFMADADGGWRVIECNPRATSGLHLFPRHVLDAWLDERAEGAFEVPAGVRRQELWSSLAELQGRALRGRVSRADWTGFVRTPDVTWAPRDPWPCLGMCVASAPLLWRALRRRRPITAVTVDDVGWYAA